MADQAVGSSSGASPKGKNKKDKTAKKAKKSKAEGSGGASVKHAEQPAPAPATTTIFGGGNVDPELDNLFAASTSYAAVPLPPPSQPIAPASQLKRKREEAAEEPASAPVPIGARKPGKKERPARTPKAEKEAARAGDASGSGSQPAGQEPDAAAPVSAKPAVPRSNGKSKAVEDASDEDMDDLDLVHESLLPGAAPKAKRDKGDRKKVKWVPEGETREERDRRTVFVGNVAIEAAKNQATLKRFRAHLLSFAPSASIESVRFRSIAFAAPTAALPVDADTPQGEKEEARRAKREKERAAKWKEEHGDEPGRGQKAQKEEDEKTYLNASQKRKVAYIKRDFHSEASTTNAYVVLAHNPPTRSANVPPILDPFIAAQQIVTKANLSLFKGHALRLDLVRPTLSAIESVAAAEGKSTLPAKREAWTQGADVKSSLFVGHLDYAAKEDDVRVFFEGLVKAERGVRTLLPGEQTTAEGPTWVKAVRLVRDRETQLGKGFGYVHFVDAECVDEILALPSDKLKFAKKPLRVEACKTLPPALGGRATPAANAKKAAAGAPAKQNGKPVRPARPAVKAAPKPIVPIVKGDPSLGTRIASLSKDERKAAKATDEQRLARRAAKKQSAKLKLANADKGTRVKLDVRSNRKDGVSKVKAKKSRVRSAHAATKMKGKRD